MRPVMYKVDVLLIREVSQNLQIGETELVRPLETPPLKLIPLPSFNPASLLIGVMAKLFREILPVRLNKCL